MKIKQWFFAGTVRKRRALLLCLMAFCLSIMCGSAAAEAWRLFGYTEEAHFPENGVRGRWLGEEEQDIYFPDGLSVQIADDRSVPADEMILVRLPGQSEYNVLVAGKALVKAEDYPMTPDRPSFVTEQEMELYPTPELAMEESIQRIQAGTLLDVIAATRGAYYVRAGDGAYGFIRKEAQTFPKTATHRYYDAYLAYTEEMYEKPAGSVAATMDEVTAVQLAQRHILDHFAVESPEHLESLRCEARLNAAHEYGMWGITWQVVFYGETDQWAMPNHFLYLPHQENTMLYDAQALLNDAYELRADLDASQRRFVEEQWQGAVKAYHVHYVVTVLQDSGKCYLLAMR